MGLKEFDFAVQGVRRGSIDFGCESAVCILRELHSVCNRRSAASIHAYYCAQVRDLISKLNVLSSCDSQFAPVASHPFLCLFASWLD